MKGRNKRFISQPRGGPGRDDHPVSTRHRGSGHLARDSLVPVRPSFQNLIFKATATFVVIGSFFLQLERLAV